MRSPFGWSLPPGVTQRMIDDAAGCDEPCAVCGRPVDDCICPECAQCRSQGSPWCYEHHGLTRSAFQIASLRQAEDRWKAEADAASEMYDRFLRSENEES